MTTLKSLYLGMAYRWHSEFALASCPHILEGLESISDTLEKLSPGINYNTTHSTEGTIILE